MERKVSGLIHFPAIGRSGDLILSIIPEFSNYLSKKNMRILIINYFYPPVVDAHAYRWEQLARHWVRNGHQVDVVTSKVSGFSYANTESGVRVFRVGVKAMKVATVDTATDETAGPKFKRLIDLARVIYRKFYWPDSAWHWIPSVTIEAIKKRHNNYDFVVSYYPCFAAHLAVNVMRFLTPNDRFTWVADYGDPFCASPTMQPNNYVFYDKLNRFAERRLVKNSDYLVFTNEATADAYQEMLGSVGDIKVIPHLVNVEHYYHGVSERNQYTEDATILTYVGGFHREVRKPDRLIDLIKRLNGLGHEKFVLHIYGPLNNYKLNELAPKGIQQIVYKGVVDRAVAVELIQNAKVIVNVDNENCIMTPSKVVECISTGNPILNISNDSVDYKPLQRYAELGFALSLDRQELSNQDVFDARNFILQSRAKPKASLETVKEVLSEHLLESVADEYLSLYKSAF